jgi:hypothetical protein
MCNLHDDKDINRIIVLTQGSRNEAIVVGVDYRGVQNTVNLNIQIAQTIDTNKSINSS